MSKRRALLLSGAALSVLICVTLFNAERRERVKSKDEEKIGVKDQPDAIGDGAKNSLSNHPGNADPTLQPPYVPISELDRARIAESVARIEVALKQIEGANSSVIYQLDGSNDTTVIVKIDLPTGEQTTPIFELLSAEARNVSFNAKVQDRFVKTAMSLVHEYTDFPLPEKYLRLVHWKDVTRMPTFIEYFVDDPKLVLPDEGGKFVMVIGEHSRIRDDSAYGSEKSWAFPRYGHIFTITDRNSTDDSK